MSTTGTVKDDNQNEISGHFQKLFENLKTSLTTIKFWLEVLALVGLFFYVCETRRTNNLTQASLSAGAIQFRSQERPYLSAEARFGGMVTASFPPDQIKAHPELGLVQNMPFSELKVPLGNGNYRIMISINVKNWGRSPAINSFVTKPKIIVGPQADARDEVIKYITDYPKESAGALMPNQDTVIGANPPADFPVINEPYETVYCFKVQTIGLPFSSCPIRQTTIR